MHDRNPEAAQTALTASSRLHSESTQASDIKAKVLRVQVILSGFWQDQNTPEELRALELADWMDVLKGIAADEVRAAWADYQITGPRAASGRLARPDAGAIYGRAIAARKAAAIISQLPRAQLAPPPPAPRVSKEAAAAILAGAGFRPKAFPGVGEGHD